MVIEVLGCLANVAAMTESRGDRRGVFDERPVEETAAEKLGSSQVPMKTRTHEYVETGYVQVEPAADGGVRIGGGEPPGAALPLSHDNLICLANEETGRRQCDHLVQWVTEAEGVSKGFGDQPKQIRAWCTKLQTASELMEIGETAVFACSARSPIDVPSANIINNFRRRQLEQAREFEQKQGEKDL